MEIIPDANNNDFDFNTEIRARINKRRGDLGLSQIELVNLLRIGINRNKYIISRC